MANLYVRKSGSDSNNGSTPALAKLTIKEAINAASSGDTIYVGSGLYRDSNITLTKNITIIADKSGIHTGDAGEVVWTGYQSDTEVPTSAYCIDASGGTYDLKLDGFIFDGWYYNVMLKAKRESFSEVKNCLFTHCRVGGIISNFNNIENCAFLGCVNTSGMTIIVVGSGTHTIKNVLIDGCGSMGAESSGIRLIPDSGVGATINIYNLTITNLVGGSGYGINAQGYYPAANYNINIYNSVINNNHNHYGIYAQMSGGATLVVNTYNTSSWNNKYANFGVTSETGAIPGRDLTIARIPYLSRYSYSRNRAASTCLTTDINGVARPSYGNTYGNIGALESTSDIIQKESTIKDSGDYSMKVSPCNYFKRTFQIPVTASELKTVKVKVRIDGTWGTTRPRVSLSGQGMTLSQATKNTTTGSFEELTVSGTPTTTGIALLTIEAHSANTDAAFYIDTITVS